MNLGIDSYAEVSNQSSISSDVGSAPSDERKQDNSFKSSRYEKLATYEDKSVPDALSMYNDEKTTIASIDDDASNLEESTSESDSEEEDDPKQAQIKYNDEEIRKAMKDSSITEGANTFEINRSDLNISEKIGEGHFGIVHKASIWGTTVALKTFPAVALEDDKDFYQELSILKSLRHMNCVLFIGFCSSPLGIAFEYMDQGSLHSLLHHANLRITHEQIFSVALSVAMGMNYLHSQKPCILHKDLKSQNVLISDNWSKISVADFGLSFLQDHQVDKPGSVQWRAPEATSTNFTTACDVYSYGVLLWECITRKEPFAGKTFEETESEVQRRHRPYIPASCPEFFRKLISRCWDADPSNRPSFGDIIQELNQFNTMLSRHKRDTARDVILRDYHSLHFSLPASFDGTPEHAPKYVRAYNSIFAEGRREDGMELFRSHAASKMLDGSIFLLGEFGQYSFLSIYESMERVKIADGRIVKKMMHVVDEIEKNACLPFSRELMESVIFDVKDGAQCAVVEKFLAKKSAIDNILPAFSNNALPLLRNLPEWRGTVVMINYSSLRVEIVNLIRTEQDLKSFRTAAQRNTQFYKEIYDSTPSFEVFNVDCGSMYNGRVSLGPRSAGTKLQSIVKRHFLNRGGSVIVETVKKMMTN